MKEIGNGFATIWKEERGLIVLMAVTTLVSAVLLIFSLATLNPASSVTKVGYGDIGGYRDGAWQTMLMFPLFALTLTLLHNLIAVKIFQKHGRALTVVFVTVTLMLAVGGFIVLGRLLGEG